MPSRKGFKEWRAPLLKQAKDRGIKVSNKNLKKLKDGYVDWFMKEYGTSFDNLTYAVYEDVIMEALMSPTVSLFKRVK